MSGKYPGKLISFEGPEGSGKSTQAEKIYRWLKAQGYDTLLTREPGGTDLGKHIRKILLDERLNITPKAEIMLYGADRAQHVEEIILPALYDGKIVLCDRYIDSSIAYQGYARGLEIEFIKNINMLAAGNVIPDLTLLYDLPAKEGFKRKKAVSFDRIEGEGLAFHEAVRKGYLEIAKRESRIKIIDASRNVESVTRDSIALVSRFLKG